MSLTVSEVPASELAQSLAQLSEEERQKLQQAIQEADEEQRAQLSLTVTCLSVAGDEKCKIPTDPCWTVRTLKQEISKITGTELINLSLLFGDKKLRNSDTVLNDLFGDETAPTVTLVTIEGRAAAASKIGGFWRKKK
eukprot:gb/GFBE01037123.1/.p1 GENE.gb/GFBE01037123.1/~~gb/GFBE01037123.1/.p1  ORF type:complete len:138 (+),score=34.24 gb/GFBE01037123.1/:1-414(+)